MTNQSNDNLYDARNFTKNANYLELQPDLYLDLKKKVEVIIPTLNEEFTIRQVIKQVQKYADKIVVVDGGSIDNTTKIAKTLGVRVITQNGRGKGAALREAFEKVEKEIIVILDADGSMIPNEIPLFLREILLGADVVKGSRFVYGGHSTDISIIRKIGNSFFVLLVNKLFGLKMTDLCYGYIAFKNTAIKKLSKDLQAEHFDIETEIILKSYKNGFNVVEVPSYELKRVYGKSNLSIIRDGYKILNVIIKEILG